jgi:hypothetical protein
MPPPLFPPELFAFIGMNVFVALSLLTSLFEEPFPTAVPYSYQIAALVGFGQIWVNYAFLSSFTETRFACSLLYLTVAVANTIAVNFYIFVKAKFLSYAGVFLGAVTIPTTFVSFLSVSSYVNGIAIPMLPLPMVPIESVYIVLIFCIAILGFSTVASLEPTLLRKMFGEHRKRQPIPRLLNNAVAPTDDPERNQKLEEEVKAE